MAATLTALGGVLAGATATAAAAVDPALGWTAAATVGGGTSAAPAAATCGYTPHLVWKGANNDSRLFHTRMDQNGNWIEQRVISAAGGTSTSPAVACSQQDGLLVAAWKGAGTDTRIFYTVSQNEGDTWSPQREVGGGRTELQPALAIVPGEIIIPARGGARPRNTPPVPFLVWKGLGADRRAHFSQLRNGVWQPPVVVPGVALDSAPGASAVLANRRGSVVWKEAGGVGMRFTTYSGDPAQPSWSPPAQIAGDGGTSAAPALALPPFRNTFAAGQFVAWKGIGSDQRLFYTRSRDGGASWDPQLQGPPDARTDTGPAVARRSFNHSVGGGFRVDGHAVVVWKAPGGDQRMYFSRGVVVQ